MFPASTRNSIRLVVHFRNKKFMVVVTGDATFQDVNKETVRVYQGISSASADESPPTIVEMQDVYGCVLFSEYPVGTILRDLADVFAFEEGDVPSSPTQPAALKPSILPHHGQLQFPIETHSTPRYQGDANEGSAIKLAASLGVVPPHVASYYSSLLCQPMVDTFTQSRYQDSPEPNRRHSTCTPSAQQLSSDGDDECSVRGSYCKEGSSTSTVTKVLQHTSSCGQAAKDTTPPTKQGQRSSVGESKQKRKRKHQSVTMIVDSDFSDEDGRQKKLPRKEADDSLVKVKVTPMTHTDVTTVGQLGGPCGFVHPEFSSDWTSEDESTSVPTKSKSTNKRKSTKKTNSSMASSTTAAASKGKSKVGSQSSSAIKLGHSKFGKSASQVHDDHSSSAFTSSEEESFTKQQSKTSSKCENHPSVESVKARTSNQRIASGSKVEHKLASARKKDKSDVSHTHGEKHHELQSKHSPLHKMPKELVKTQELIAEENECTKNDPMSPAHSKVGISSVPISAHHIGSERMKKRKGQIVGEKHSIEQNKLRAEERELKNVDDVFSSGSQSTFCETHNTTATLYMKPSITASESPKSAPQQTETDKRANKQSTSNSDPGDVQNIPPRETHSSEEILAEDSQDLDVGIIPATQPTAKSTHNTAETTVIEETQDVEDYKNRSPEVPDLGQTERTCEETCPGPSPESTEKDEMQTNPKPSPRRIARDGVTGKYEQMERINLDKFALRTDEEVVADAKQTSGKAPDGTENDKGSHMTSNGTSLPKNGKHKAGVKDSTVEGTTTQADSGTATGRAVQQQDINETSEQAEKHADLRGERLVDDVVGRNSVPQTNQQQNLRSSSFSVKDEASCKETIQDGVASSCEVEFSHPTREPSEQRKREAPQNSKSVKRKKRRKEKLSTEKGKRKDVDGDGTVTDSLASGTIPSKSGDNTTLFPSNPAQISPVKTTKLSTLPDRISTESSLMDETSQGLQSTATNQLIVPSVHAPSDTKSEHKEVTTESPHSIAGKSLKLRMRRYVSSESDLSPSKSPMKKQKLSDSSQASSSQVPSKTPPSAGKDGAQHGSIDTENTRKRSEDERGVVSHELTKPSPLSDSVKSSASRKKRSRKTAMLSPSHGHISSDTEAKRFGLSPRMHHPLRKNQSPSVAPSSSQLKRRRKAVTQPTELNFSTLSQEEAEYSQGFSINLSELLNDEKLWDDK